MIADAMDRVGRDGVITVDEGQGLTLELESTDGMRFDRGYVSAYFVTDPQRMEATLTSRHTDDRPEDHVDERHRRRTRTAHDRGPKKELLVIAEDVDGEALATLVVNKLRGILNVVAAQKAPGFGDRRQELLGALRP